MESALGRRPCRRRRLHPDPPWIEPFLSSPRPSAQSGWRRSEIRPERDWFLKVLGSARRGPVPRKQEGGGGGGVRSEQMFSTSWAAKPVDEGRRRQKTRRCVVAPPGPFGLDGPVEVAGGGGQLLLEANPPHPACTEARRRRRRRVAAQMTAVRAGREGGGVGLHGRRRGIGRAAAARGRTGGGAAPNPSLGWSGRGGGEGL